MDDLTTWPQLPEVVPVRRRTVPERIRYYAGLLCPADGTPPADYAITAVLIGLEVLAAELEADQHPVEGSYLPARGSYSRLLSPLDRPRRMAGFSHVWRTMDTALLADRHPGTQQIARHFRFDHLPEYLQTVSRPCCVLAEAMIRALPDGPELTAGLRKLLEAKDAFVRARLEDD